MTRPSAVVGVTDVSNGLKPRLLTVTCMAIALVEGFDLQAAGVVAPALSNAFKLSPRMLGAFFSISIVGLMIGAVVGGRLADRFGRKSIVLTGIALFGIASIATSLAYSFPVLLITRFVTGLGIGGVMPAIIALTAESEGENNRGAAVARLYAGFPLGGAVAALVAIAGWGNGWRTIFVIGGVAPVMLGLVVTAVQFSSRPSAHDLGNRSSAPDRLFANGRLGLSAGLWLSFFLSLLLMYVLMNWLPKLLALAGISNAVAGWTQVAMNLGGALGGIALAIALARWSRTRVIAVIYLCLLIATPLLAVTSEPLALILLAAPIGAAINAAQAVLYGIAPAIYPSSVRATGVGIGVTVGRLGAIAGPLLAAQLLTFGLDARDVLLAAVPVIVAAGFSAAWLSRQLAKRMAALKS